MSNKLVIDKGNLIKKAQGQPGQGPSFEQQFGILANAQITDKYPSLSSYQVAFQLLQKDDENTNASGAVVYRIGKNVIQIPAFFYKGRIKTGEIMYVPVTDSFLPLSDAWLSWLKNKDVSEAGELIPAEELKDKGVDQFGARIKDYNDPLMKQASVLNTALKMGKKASQNLLGALQNTDFLNACLHFYTPQELSGFAKTASEMFQDVEKPRLVTVMSKEASLLSDIEKQQLWRDGWLIKNAQVMDWQEAPDKAVKVTRETNVSKQFSEVRHSCKCQLLKMNGQLMDATVIVAQRAQKPAKNNHGEHAAIFNRNGKQSGEQHGTGTSQMDWEQFPLSYDVDKTASMKQLIKKASEDSHSMSIFVYDGHLHRAVAPVCLTSSVQDIKQAVGKNLQDMQQLPAGAVVMFPSGQAIQLSQQFFKDDKGFYSCRCTIQVADDNIVKPVFTGSNLIVPKGTKVMVPVGYSQTGKTQDTQRQPDNIGLATAGALTYAVTNFVNKTYDKVKLTADGQQISVSGAKSNVADRLVEKEAAYHLVCDYGVSPEDAKLMVKQAMANSQKHAVTISYYLTKSAVYDDPEEWEDADIPSSRVANVGPQIEQKSMDEFELDDEAMQTVETAADNGIKEIFDMQTLKLLIQVADPQEQIMDILPDFMHCLDQLCRLLFIFRSHVGDMQDKYGLTKLKALQQSIVNTLKDLSELTVFLKIRGLSNDANPNADAGDLQTGRMFA